MSTKERVVNQMKINELAETKIFPYIAILFVIMVVKDKSTAIKMMALLGFIGGYILACYKK